MKRYFKCNILLSLWQKPMLRHIHLHCVYNLCLTKATMNLEMGNKHVFMNAKHTRLKIAHQHERVNNEGVLRVGRRMHAQKDVTDGIIHNIWLRVACQPLEPAHTYKTNSRTRSQYNI